MSESAIEVWPTIAIDCPAPLNPVATAALMSGLLTSYMVAMSFGVRKWFPLMLEVKFGLGFRTCGRGRKFEMLLTPSTTGAKAAGILTSRDGAKCVSAPTL